LKDVSSLQAFAAIGPFAGSPKQAVLPKATIRLGKVAEFYKKLDHSFGSSLECFGRS